MKSLYEIQRVRYPPFEASRWIPEALPVATKRIHLGDFATEDDVLAAHGEHGPAFMIGKEDAWLLERHYEYGGEAFQLGESQGRVERDPFVPLVKRQRRGWYLIPNPIHNILRAFIRAVVVVLLASLFYLFVSPLLLFIGLPVYGLNTIRWGLLDYPALAVFVVPLIFAPLFIRVLANLVELRRQQHFLNKNPPPLRFNSMNRPMQTSHSKSTSSFRIGLKPGTMSTCFGEWVCFHLRGSRAYGTWASKRQATSAWIFNGTAAPLGSRIGRWNCRWRRCTHGNSRGKRWIVPPSNANYGKRRKSTLEGRQRGRSRGPKRFMARFGEHGLPPSSLGMHPSH